MPIAAGAELALICGAAFVLARFAALVRLPPVLGMLTGGALAGALALPVDLPGVGVGAVSESVRLGILAIVLARAGLSLSFQDLKGAGVLGLRLGTIPMIGDALLVAAAAAWLLGMPLRSALVCGFLLAAISPAIVLPGLLDLISDERVGGRRVLTAMLVGAPIDNISALLCLGIALDLALSAGGSWTEVMSALPVSLGGGLLLGSAVGWGVGLVLRSLPRHVSRRIGSLLVWAVACGLVAAGKTLGLSFVLAVIAFGVVLRGLHPDLVELLDDGLRRTFSVLQYALFGLVGAAVDPASLTSVGLVVVAVVLFGQLGRAGASWLATAGSGLEPRERYACILAYVPKATIQAAFAALPLDRGLPEGSLILGAAVLAVALTAPVGVVTLQRGVAALLRPRGLGGARLGSGVDI